MAETETTYFPAYFVPSQKGTLLLMDENNHKYRIGYKNLDHTIATYTCVQRIAKKCPAKALLHIESSRIVKFKHNHCHSSNLLKDIARAEETRMIAAAVAVGCVSTKTASAKIKV
jgi:hypothetical protein